MRLEIAGERFGKLVAIEATSERRYGRTVVWRFQCDCGNEFRQSAKVVKRGGARSCGCSPSGHPTHGMSRTAYYRRWWNIINRCENPNVPSYADYGARGIRVCERWRKFENFLADMGAPPFKGAEIDRINNDGDYEPGNCRWTTRHENAGNKRNVKLREAFGRTQHLAAWAREYGLNYTTLLARVTKQGLPLEAALTKAVPSFS